MFKRPPIPERLSSLMPPDRQDSLNRHKQRSASATSQLSQMSMNSNASDYFDAKVAAWQSEVDYIRCVREGLEEAKAAKLLSDAEFRKQVAPFLKPFRSASETLKVLKRQHQLLVEDFEEQVEAKRQRSHEPEEGFLERAYKDTIVPRVMAAQAKQKAQNFDQNAFKRAVCAYYGIVDHKDFIWCHVLGAWLPAKSTKAAHLVPKSMTKQEISHLFGAEQLVLSDPRNGITLCHTIEDAMDAGTIVIVPIPGETTAPTRWRCVLINEQRKEDIVWRKMDGEIIKFKHIDNKELKFLTENRPRRRFLYFRFLISYLNAKNNNYHEFTHKVEAKRFWPTLGPYLRKSTLVTLARCVSGSELPRSLIEGYTFDSEDTTKDKDAGMILSADLSSDLGSDLSTDLRGALIESIKASSKGMADDEESDEE